MKDKIVIYKDLTDAGECYTIYKNGEFFAHVLSDDPQLKEISPTWEDLVVEGLDNRTQG
jgi:hypothetical protein